MRKEVNYFGAGPAKVPSEIIEQAAKDLIDYDNQGIGLGELSHRSSQGSNVVKDTEKHLRNLLNIPDDYAVLFFQGGGTGAFASVVYTFMAAHAYKSFKTNNAKDFNNIGEANYIVTGTWSDKAADEARKILAPVGVNSIVNSNDSNNNSNVNKFVHIACDTRKINNNGKFTSLPTKSDIKLSPNPAYVYICDNETVHGVEWPYPPQEILGDYLKKNNIPLIADMSSNILSRDIDVTKYSCIVAGAQKNVGIAGVTIAIIQKDIIQDADSYKKLFTSGELNDSVKNTTNILPVSPSVFDFALMLKSGSLYNTLPIFTLRVTDLVLQRLISQGGLKKQQHVAQVKAGKLYATLDSFPSVYNLPVDSNARSIMNIVFTLNSKSKENSNIEEEFFKQATAKGLHGLKGHRSVGGVRVSNYNAVTEDSIDLLIQFLSEFGKAHK